jgi:hypothetical protein
MRASNSAFSAPAAPAAASESDMTLTCTGADQSNSSLPRWSPAVKRQGGTYPFAPVQVGRLQGLQAGGAVLRIDAAGMRRDIAQAMT